jgi:hypothetical protein
MGLSVMTYTRTQGPSQKFIESSQDERFEQYEGGQDDDDEEVNQEGEVNGNNTEH